MANQGNKAEELAVVPSEPIELIDESQAEPQSQPQAESKPESKEEQIPDNKKQDKEEYSSEDEDEVEVEEAPVPPPRPISPITKITNELKDAFPSIEDKIITAVLIASQGNVDPAFNALLYLSDPSFEPEIPNPTTVAPQISGSISAPGTINNPSITDDEKLARKLQKEFEYEEARRRQHRHERKRGAQTHKNQQYEEDTPDEFDQLKETFTQGLEEARSTLNDWVSGLAKKFQDNDEKAKPSQSKQSPKLFGALGGSSFNSNKKKNTRFDEDPEIISNDFHNKISLTDNDDVGRPALPTRQKEQQDDKAHLNENTNQQSDSYIQSNKKWQPLNSDVPINSDAFLVTDSEDEDTGVSNYDTSKKATTENSNTQ